MTKNEKQLIGRKRLIEMCINDPEKGAEYIRRASETIRRTRTADQTIKALSELLFLSESTITKDLYRNNFVKTELKAIAV